jgi:hypothetical protein
MIRSGFLISSFHPGTGESKCSTATIDWQEAGQPSFDVPIKFGYNQQTAIAIRRAGSEMNQATWASSRQWMKLQAGTENVRKRAH